MQTVPVQQHIKPRGWLVRVAWSTTAFGAFAAGVAVVHSGGVSWWLLALFVVAPDFSFLAGVGGDAEKGQLPGRAVPVYNAVHRPAVPIGLIAVAALAAAPAGVVAGLGWLTHIAVDRAVGYGLRTPDGWIRG